jgi:hypothetical protein
VFCRPPQGRRANLLQAGRRTLSHLMADTYWLDAWPETITSLGEGLGSSAALADQTPRFFGQSECQHGSRITRPSLYCSGRDDCVFLPPTGQVARADQMMALLYQP